MHERDAEILYFAEVPALHDLCLVVASVPTSYKLGSGKQPHIIRCRYVATADNTSEVV